jgi:hypothetical protein
MGRRRLTTTAPGDRLLLQLEIRVEVGLGLVAPPLAALKVAPAGHLAAAVLRVQPLDKRELF